MRMPITPCSPVSAREVFAYQLARRGYDPNLGATKDALDAFDAAMGFAIAQRSDMRAALEAAQSHLFKYTGGFAANAEESALFAKIEAALSHSSTSREGK